MGKTAEQLMLSRISQEDKQILSVQGRKGRPSSVISSDSGVEDVSVSSKESSAAEFFRLLHEAAPSKDVMGRADTPRSCYTDDRSWPTEAETAQSSTVGRPWDFVDESAVMKPEKAAGESAKVTTCRIRVRQDMFQEKKEEDISDAKVEQQDIAREESIVVVEHAEMANCWDEEEDIVHQQEAAWSSGTTKEEDLKDCLPAAARSPPPRILSRRLDYRRQRRHQWRSPCDLPPATGLGGGSQVKPKRKAPELITLNLNTECLDPEPPVLHRGPDTPPFYDPRLAPADWQIMIQPAEASAEVPNNNAASGASGHNNYLVHKLKLRNPKLCEARLPREKENRTELNTTSSTTTRSGSSSRLATLLTTTMASSPGRSYNSFYVFIVHSPFFCKGCVSFCFISTGTVEGPAPSILRWIRSQSFLSDPAPAPTY